MKSFLLLILISTILSGCFTSFKSTETLKEEEHNQKMNPDGFIGGLTIDGIAFQHRVDGFNDNDKINGGVQLRVPLTENFTISAWWQQVTNNSTTSFNYSTASPNIVNFRATDLGVKFTIYMRRIF